MPEPTVSPPTPKPALPAFPGSHVPFGVNEMRLNWRHWAAVVLLLVVAVVAIPRVWTRLERFETGPDYRIPYELSKDYWLFQRRLNQVNERTKIFVLGDSVVWGDSVGWGDSTATGSRVYACTMRSGQGIKNKQLEAMACGLPAVATPQSLGGLEVTSGRELLVGGDEGSFARDVIRLLSDPAGAARLGAAGRAYVVAHHSWHSVGLAFERTYREAVEERASSGRA